LSFNLPLKSNFEFLVFKFEFPAACYRSRIIGASGKGFFLLKQSGKAASDKIEIDFIFIKNLGSFVKPDLSDCQGYLGCKKEVIPLQGRML
jgi:hypothetical protein